MCHNCHVLSIKGSKEIDTGAIFTVLLTRFADTRHKTNFENIIYVFGRSYMI